MMRFSFAIGPAVRAAPRPSPRSARAARAVGLLCGLAVFAFALHSWAVASTGPALGTDLEIAAVAPGELQLSSPRVLQAPGMQPHGRLETGTLRIRNITGVPVRVRIRALPSTRALDDVLRLSAVSGGRPVAAGNVGTLRHWSSRHLTLGVRESLTIGLRARLHRPAQGLIADVTLELDADPVRRR